MRYVFYAASLPLKIVWAAIAGAVLAIFGASWKDTRHDAIRWFAIPD